MIQSFKIFFLSFIIACGVVLAGQTTFTIYSHWGMYDIDMQLTKKGYISTGEFINYAQSAQTISALSGEFAFLRKRKATSLEGFLYPDTYKIDTSSSQSAISSLSHNALTNFHNKIYRKQRILTQIQKVVKKQYGKALTHNQILTLASIIQKEDSNTNNTPTIFGVFLNRLLLDQSRMAADITICYGLRIPYTECRKNLTKATIQDETNPYNTRKVKGFTPTPISNPTIQTLIAMTKIQKHEFRYYLHGGDKKLYPAKTYQEHLENYQYLD